MMTDPRTIPWKRIAEEAVTIVVSILLAFAIDAWWATRQDRQVERAALQALQSDLITSRENMSGLLKALTKARENFVRVRRAMEIHGGPFLQWSRRVDNFEILPAVNGEVLAVLRQDADFISKARSHQYVLSGYLWELRKLAETLDSTLALLNENVGQH